MTLTETPPMALTHHSETPDQGFTSLLIVGGTIRHIVTLQDLVRGLDAHRLKAEDVPRFFDVPTEITQTASVGTNRENVAFHVPHEAYAVYRVAATWCDASLESVESLQAAVVIHRAMMCIENADALKGAEYVHLIEVD